MDPSRRQVLVGAIALSAACKESRPARPDPSVLVLDAAIAREQALLAAYGVTLLRAPSPELEAFREDHAAHLAALVSARPTPPPTPSPTLTAPPLPPAVPLGSLERTTAAAHAAAAVTAPARLAPLLASIAASESSHAALL